MLENSVSAARAGNLTATLLRSGGWPISVEAKCLRRIAVVGTGYVGLTTGACLASLGHHVICADVDEEKIRRLQDGKVDILEPGLSDLVAEGLAAGRLAFTVGAAVAVEQHAEGVEVVFLCVPTPMGVGGVADLRAVEAVLDEIRDTLPSGCVIVNKSTVPVGTAVRTAELLGRSDVAVTSNPEFLREGTAVRDFLNPDRIVVGGGGTGRGRTRRGALLQARRADCAHRFGQCRTGEVRGQRISGDEVVVRQRGG